MKRHVLYCGVLLSLLLFSVAAQAQKKIIKAYRQALEEGKGYFKMELKNDYISCDEEALLNFVQSNPDLECKYSSCIRYRYGNFVFPVIKAEFVIKSNREKEYERLFKRYDDSLTLLGYRTCLDSVTKDYYWVKVINKPEITLERLFRIPYLELKEDSLMQMYVDWVKFARKDYFSQNIEGIEKGTYYPIKDSEYAKEMTDIVFWGRVYRVFGETPRITYPRLAIYEEQERDYQKAMTGTLKDCLLYYNWYTTFTNRKHNMLSREFKARLYDFLGSKETFDKESEQLKYAIYKYAYEHISISREYRKIDFNSTILNKMVDYLDRVEESRHIFFDRITKKASFFMKMYQDYDPDQYIEKVATRLVQANYESFKSTLQYFREDRECLNAEPPSARSMERMFEMENTALQIAKSPDERAKILEYKKRRIELMPEYNDISSHCDQVREARKERRRIENCLACEIDEERTEWPDKKEDGGFLYMKNGNSYWWKYSSEGGYVVDVGFFSDTKVSTFTEMIRFFEERCRREYCR